MSGIVCAIRGGPGSQTTIAQAITLAKETGLVVGNRRPPALGSGGQRL